MNVLEDDNYINKLYDELTNSRNALMLELKNDKELTKEKFINPKLQCVETITKLLLKYRNIRIKEKIKSQ
jgi:hypothetical protein